MPGLINWQLLAPVSTTEAGGSTSLRSRFKGVAEERTLPSLLLPKKTVRIYPMPGEQGLAFPEMSASVRLRQLTDPMAEVATARFCGIPNLAHKMFLDCSTNRSENEPNSVCLAAMVLEFMENEASVGKWGGQHHTCCDRNCLKETCSRFNNVESKPNSGVDLSDILQGIVTCVSSLERIILSEVKSIIDMTCEEVGINRNVNEPKCTSSCRKLAVVRQLRRAGYSAAICKSRWDQAGECPAGDYEYIDALVEGTSETSERVIVDVDFRAQFEIARPTRLYLSMLQALPSVFVGKPDRLRKILNLMSDAAKQSLKKKGLYLPPWRTPDYMMAKWFSSYKRLTNDSVCPYKSDDTTDGREFVSIAVRGCGLDAKYTQLESKCHEMENSKNHFAMVENTLQSEEGEITTKIRDWQPPAVNAKQFQRPSKVTGLASLLLQAGLAVKLTPDHQMHQSSKGGLALAA